MLSVDTLAKVILNNSYDVSNKKLQKLSYYVYSWYLAIYRIEIAPMQFEAWEHGPVCRELYNKYKRYGWNSIPPYKGFVLANDGIIRFIQSVLSVYGGFSADKLEDMTHEEDPWRLARQGCQWYESSDAIISKEIITEFYGSQYRVKELILSHFALNQGLMY